jgi:hypothetical protein
MMERLLENMEANREKLKGIMDANTKAMQEDIKSGQAETKSAIGPSKRRWTP